MCFNLIPILLSYDEQKLRYNQSIYYIHPIEKCWPFCFLAAILKMAEFEVARNHFLMCVM